jgi:hypothetical protein
MNLINKILTLHHHAKLFWARQGEYPVFVLYVDSNTFSEMRANARMFNSVIYIKDFVSFDGMRVYEVLSDKEHIQIYPEN